MAIGEVGNMRYYVYILKSEKNGKYYIGSTNDIERRMSEHNRGRTRSLVHLRPLRLVCAQGYTTSREARLIEQKLKRLKNKRILERIVQDGKIKMGL